MNKRLVIAGPESTGKSAMLVRLAERLQLPAAGEYARVYLEEHGPAYTYDLLLTMSQQHKAYQAKHVPEDAHLGLFDTDLINYKIWCEVVYGKCHPEILSAMEAETGHLYLLCYPDLPWEEDPLRENEDDRLELFDLHLQEVERLGRPFAVVRGLGQERFVRAEALARQLLGR